MKRDSLVQELINHTTTFWQPPQQVFIPRPPARKFKIGDLIATQVPCSKNLNSSTEIQGVVVNLSGCQVEMEITSIPQETSFYLGQLHTTAINKCWRIRPDVSI